MGCTGLIGLVGLVGLGGRGGGGRRCPLGGGFGGGRGRGCLSSSLLKFSPSVTLRAWEFCSLMDLLKFGGVTFLEGF